MQEHPAVDDRLAAGPADLLEQLWHRFRQDDVRTEVGHVPRHRTPACCGGVDRHDDLARADAAARRRDLAVADPPRLAALVELDAGCEDGPAQRADEPRRLRGRAVREENAATKNGRPNASLELTPVERHGLLGHAHRCETISMPPSRSQTSSGSDRTAGITRSPARASASASSRPRSGTSSASDAQ